MHTQNTDGKKKCYRNSGNNLEMSVMSLGNSFPSTRTLQQNTQRIWVLHPYKTTDKTEFCELVNLQVVFRNKKTPHAFCSAVKFGFNSCVCVCVCVCVLGISEH
jgi:hypothetical protein